MREIDWHLNTPRLATAGAFAAACAALTLLGCGNIDDETGGEVVAKTAPLISATANAADTLGTPLLTMTDPGLSGICTGTLMRPNVVLTAHSCVTNGKLSTGGQAIAPQNLTAQITGGPNAPRGVRIVRHPSLDVALVQLEAAPTDVNGRTYSNRLYVASNAKTVSQVAMVQGWGPNAITQCVPTMQGTGAGTMRFGFPPITALVDINFYKLAPNNMGVVGFLDDAGSSTFMTVKSIFRPSGVMSYSNCTQSPLQVTEAIYTRSDAFRGWANGVLGIAPSIGPTAGFERADMATSIVYVQGGHIKDVVMPAAAGSNWTLGDITASANAPAAAVTHVPVQARADGASTVVYKSTDSHAIELALSPANNWETTDLTLASGAPNVDSVRIATYVRSDNVTSVLHADPNGKIRELYRNPGSTSWFQGNLTQLAGAPDGYAPVGYVRGDATNAVVYVDNNNQHVRELKLAGGTWVQTDLTNATGAVNAVQEAHPYTRSDGFSIVLFRSLDLHIWELALSPDGGSWSKADLTDITHCANALNDPSPYVRADGINAVIYKDNVGHIRELALVSGGWVCGDVTAAAAGAPNVGTEGPNGFIGADGKSHVVYRSITDGHIRDLTLNSNWTHTDVTAIAGGP